MSISKYNSEGYPDPTAFGALSSIENEAHALSDQSYIYALPLPETLKRM